MAQMINHIETMDEISHHTAIAFSPLQSCYCLRKNLRHHRVAIGYPSTRYNGRKMILVPNIVHKLFLTIKPQRPLCIVLYANDVN